MESTFEPDKHLCSKDILLLVLIMEQKLRKYFVKLNFFSFSKPNVVYLRPFSTSLQFPKF